jgi:hypothetical protein
MAPDLVDAEARIAERVAARRPTGPPPVARARTPSDDVDDEPAQLELALLYMAGDGTSGV